MASSLFNQKTTNSLFSRLGNAVGIASGDPGAMFQGMYQANPQFKARVDAVMRNPQFKAFLAENKDMTLEQIVQKYNVNLNNRIF
jgi:hypothetical protein